jgi:hypothetical protein
VDSVSGATQRKLLRAINGRGNVAINEVLSAVYGSEDAKKLETLLKSKDRLNCTLSMKNAKCEVRKEGNTLTLRPI